MLLFTEFQFLFSGFLFLALSRCNIFVYYTLLLLDNSYLLKSICSFQGISRANLIVCLLKYPHDCFSSNFRFLEAAIILLFLLFIDIAFIGNCGWSLLFLISYVPRKEHKNKQDKHVLRENTSYSCWRP